jgi:hypothetical protein
MLSAKLRNIRKTECNTIRMNMEKQSGLEYEAVKGEVEIARREDGWTECI